MAERGSAPGSAHLHDLTPAMEATDEIVALLLEGEPAVFLDFDGTLAPITTDPGRTVLPEDTRAAVEALRSVCPVAVVSGRDLDDVRRLVGVEGIHYAGSHGFDVLDAAGRRHRKARDYRPDLERAADELDRALEHVEGAFVERKAFALAVHYRMLEDPARSDEVEAAVDRVAVGEPRLRKTGGKMIFEVRPDIDWHKGKAVEMLCDLIGGENTGGAPGPTGFGRSREEAADRVVPLYVGDDLTDEDAFEAVRERGVGVVVRGEDDDRLTAARYVLEDPMAVRAFLEDLAGRLAPTTD